MQQRADGRTNGKNLTTTTSRTSFQSIDSCLFLSVKEQEETNESSNDDDDDDDDVDDDDDDDDDFMMIL